MWLFDRVFRQPPTKDVLPEENLASEITAFFLDHFAPLRARFLAEIELGQETGSCTVDTQKQLDGPGRPWHDMIPDITLTDTNGRFMVLIEVKIDAGPTYDKQGRPQTCAYAEYLTDQREKGSYAQTRLVALTRWCPDRSFSEPCNSIIRFNDLRTWIKEALLDAPTSDPVLATLANKWGECIQNRRWAMEPITREHLAAIRQIEHLVAQLEEVLGAARQEVIGTDRWQMRPRGRKSRGRYVEGQRQRKGHAVWIAPMCLKEDLGGWVQMGCFYGDEGGKEAIRPVIWVHESYQGRLPPDAANRLEAAWPPGKCVWLENVAPQVENGEVWDCMRQSLVRTLAQMK